MARVARMLDACAELVDEIGYEALTTTLLAERAGVAIGSVYQFFPDKRAVVQALTLRNLEAYLDRLAERFAGRPASRNWWDGVDAAHRRVHRHAPDGPGLPHPALRRRRRRPPARRGPGQQRGHRGRAAGAAGRAASGWPTGERLDFALTIAVEIADALIKLAFRRDPKGDPQVLAEAKTIIRDYLEGQFT